MRTKALKTTLTMSRPAALLLVVVLCCSLLLGLSEALLSVVQQRKKNKAAAIPDRTFEQPNVVEAGITETACIDTANRMQRVKVPVSSSIHPDEEVGISYSYWPAANNNRRQKKKLPPVVLIHGFDSSNLEFRRFGSQMAERGVDCYAVDLLGWGYTQLEGVTDFSASAKVESLQNFLQTVVKEPFVISGASLGGAAAIETAAYNINCQGLILIDAQGFVDGIGPMALMPKTIAGLGVEILKSVPLRSSANQMSYFDKETYATDEAVIVGRLHCLRDGWSDALVNFMKSGGFRPSKLVEAVDAPSLVLWGRQDTILDGNEFANKFMETLPNAQLKWIENCGHVPHLEQPEETADAILNFVASLPRKSSEPYSLDVKSAVTGGLGVIGLSALAGSFAADFLPLF